MHSSLVPMLLPTKGETEPAMSFRLGNYIWIVLTSFPNLLTPVLGDKIQYKGMETKLDLGMRLWMELYDQTWNGM